MPAVQRMLREASGLPLDVGVNPVVAVALGAAIYAQMLETGSGVTPIPRHAEGVPEPESEQIGASELEPFPEDTAAPPLVFRDSDDQTTREAEPFIDEADIVDGELIVDVTGDDDAAESEEAPRVGTPPPLPPVRFVTAHGVGVKVRSGEDWRNSVLIPRNTRVPVKVSKQFVTASETDGGTRLKVEITQGDTPDVSLAEVLGTGTIEEFPTREAPGQPVEVEMEFDDQGRLHVDAIYVNTGQRMQMSLEIPGALRPEEVERYRDRVQRTTFLTVFRPEEAPEEFGLDEDEDDGLLDSSDDLR